MTKKLLQWAKTAALFCGAFVFNACTNSDNPVDGMTGASSIAMIVKNGNIGYFQQIEKSFRETCKEKDFVGFYYSTTNETAYQEQVAAVADLRKQDIRKLRGIIFTPSYGPNGESAEAEVAALAEELGIPVIIVDSPVKATSPLASSPYFGTDNTAAGEAMAEYVAADRVAVFAMKGSPGIERAEAFKALKPNATVYQVAEKCNDEVQAVLDDFDDFVFFNGNDLVDALPMLKAAGKRVYTFDVYGEFLDELIAGSPCLRGVMAQNTFDMARKAVDAIIANAKQGEMVPIFYITAFNLDDENVKPFLDFYDKQLPVIVGLSEKIIGKWMTAEVDDQPVLTNNQKAITFVSTAKAYISASFNANPVIGAHWLNKMEVAVDIDGNKVTVTSHPDDNVITMEELIITTISGSEFTANRKLTATVNGIIVDTKDEFIRYVKLTADYSEAILGLWECQAITGGETNNDANARLEFKADGTYNFYRKTDGGEWEAMTTREFQNYFVDGTLLATRWKDAGTAEQREWWEINSIADGQMQWTALRQNADGTTFQQSVKWTKVN